MHDLADTLLQLRRPRLLVRAARIGAQDYRRDRHLARLVGGGSAGDATARPLERLMAAEAPLDLARREGTAGYSPARHVALLSAIIAEQRLARLAFQGPERTCTRQENASGSEARFPAMYAPSASEIAGSIAGGT
ncbi:DUF6477 family protein [Roseivivax sediminis]|uniref:Uncharacterized protein n=1 Tax=Roseivivax sediminis TaxID=936889 RepID=A0A1I2D4N8_9RHOB|nr:DUF6477 family protein [Roseivivax sediminis]SFE75474.1 hypothetical protein SAMN04515678_11568 [Roseivivax sediminis]